MLEVGAVGSTMLLWVDGCCQARCSAALACDWPPGDCNAAQAPSICRRAAAEGSPLGCQRRRSWRSGPA